ncbi:MAG: carboxypeptidase-like regulatory domain-containing protein [Terriglobia bacterium]
MNLLGKTALRLAVVLFGLSMLTGSGSLFAQSGRGTINGTILDSAGAVVQGVKITVTDPATGVSSTTESTDVGTYTVPDLPVGLYTLRVEKQGFKTIIRSGITLTSASVIRVDFTLEIGEVRQEIEVTGDISQVQTEEAKISSNVSNLMIKELPLVVGGALRSPFDLATLTPETKLYATQIALQPGPNNLSPVQDSLQIGGGQPRAYGITLDGVSMGVGNPLPNSWVTYNTPPLDAITEFTVETNGYKAEFGHALGGTMSFASKSGTNDFHGTVFEYLRNNALDANRFFSNKQGIPRGVYKQSDFGVSVGGPVYIPKLYNGKNKLFFFTAYEGFRNRIGATATATTIPTPEMLQGDFSNWVNSKGQQITIYDPATTRTDANGKLIRDPFPGNIIPQDRWDPLAAKLLQVYQSGPSKLPAPNNGALPGTVGYVQNNYLITQGSTSSPWNKFSLKLDYVISDKNKLSFYFGHNTETNGAGPAGPAALPGYYSNFQSQYNWAEISRGSWTHTFSPTLLNYFYGGVNNWQQEATNANQQQGNWKSTFCLPNVPDCNVNLTTLLFGFGWLYAMGSYSSSGSHNPLFNFNDNLTWIKGRHPEVRGMYQKNYYSGFGQQGISGGVTFSPTETGLPGVTSFAAGGRNALASYLLGWADSGRTETFQNTSARSMCIGLDSFRTIFMSTAN